MLIRTIHRISFLLCLFGLCNFSIAQVVYNESFDVSGGVTNTLALGWNQGKYGAGTDPDNRWDRTPVGTYPTASPHSGSGMMRYISFSVSSGQGSWLASKKMDMRAGIPAVGAPFSFWMYRDGAFGSSPDRIQVYLNTTPNMSGTPVGPLVETNTSAVAINRACNLPPTAVTCAGWNQYNYVIPDGSVFDGSQNVYIILVAISGYGNNMYVDDLSATSYPLPQTYTNSSAFLFLQYTSIVNKNSTNQPIIGCKMNISGAATPLVLSKMIFSTNGSTNPVTDITNAKLWFTGGTSVFNLENAQLLGTYNSPWSVRDTFLVANWMNYPVPSLTAFNRLEHGDNYFWITYDIPSTAITSNFVDAEWLSFSLNSPGIITPVVTSLPGARPIDLCATTLANSITAVGGNTPVCPGDVKTYSTTPLPGALQYNWILPPGTAVISGQGTLSITVSYNVLFNTDSLRVRALFSCGYGPARAIKISRDNPSAPGSITASINNKACPGEIHGYSIAPVANATGYLWTAPPGATISSGQGTTSITVTYGASFLASDTLKVVSTNSCGSSAMRIMKIIRNNPNTPAPVTGNTYNLCNQAAIPYSTVNVPGMVYNWSFSSGGATVVTGQGTSSITADFGPGFLTGMLSVNATNGCGTSNNRNLNVRARPPVPGVITGANSVCANQQNEAYSISPMVNVTTYTWNVPNGSTISDGTITSSGTTLVTSSANVTVDFGTNGGDVKVQASNACATSNYQSMAVAMPCRMMADETNDQEPELFPNPNRGDFSIKAPGASINPVSLTIIDAIGKTVYSKIIYADAPVEFKLNLRPGLYHVSIKSSVTDRVLRMVVE